MTLIDTCAQKDSALRFLPTEGAPRTSAWDAVDPKTILTCSPARLAAPGAGIHWDSVPEASGRPGNGVGRAAQGPDRGAGRADGHGGPAANHRINNGVSTGRLAFTAGAGLRAWTFLPGARVFVRLLDLALTPPQFTSHRLACLSAPLPEARPPAPRSRPRPAFAPCAPVAARVRALHGRLFPVGQWGPPFLTLSLPSPLLPPSSSPSSYPSPSSPSSRRSPSSPSSPSSRSSPPSSSTSWIDCGPSLG